MLRCSSEKCISEELRDDTILNCPPPRCLDESDCVNHEKPSMISVPDDLSDSSQYIVPAVVVAIVALIGVLCFCKKKKAAASSQRSDDGHVEELRPTAQSDLDTYLEFQDVRPEQQHSRMPMPSVPEGQHRMQFPLVPPDQQYDRPMPSAPLSGYNDNPPPYDALFNPDKNKRANV